jgi:peptide deformylase
MILPIYTDPQPVLRAKCAPVSLMTEELHQLVADMRETMRNADGLGLAAPQIGRPIQLFITEYPDRTDPIPFTVFINPKITWRSSQRGPMNEGCLSLPGLEAEIKRPYKVRVTAQDLTMKRFTIELDGLWSRVVQHEYDHLQGKLFTDYVPASALYRYKAPDYPKL